MSGDKNAPLLEAYDTVTIPKGYAKPQALKWFFQEIQDLSGKLSFDGIVLKGAEGQAIRDKAFVDRIEMEAMVFYAGAQLGIKPVLRKIKSQLAKGLGLKGRAKYLQGFDTSAVSDYEHLPKNVQEAILAAWSELK
jgi:hypothetical protein